MRLVAFVFLTLAGTGAGLVVGLATLHVPPYRMQHTHMVQNTAGGAVAGMIVGAIAIWLTGGSSKKD